MTPLDIGGLVPRVTALATGAPGPGPANGDPSAVTPSPSQISSKGGLRDPARRRERRDVERSASTWSPTPIRRPCRGPSDARRSRGSCSGFMPIARPARAAADRGDQEDRDLRRRLSGSVRCDVPGETLGQILLQKRLITGEPWRIRSAGCRRKNASKGSPDRDERALALRPGSGAGRTGGRRAVRNLLVEQRQEHVRAGGGPADQGVRLEAARRVDPRRHPHHLGEAARMGARPSTRSDIACRPTRWCGSRK